MEKFTFFYGRDSGAHLIFSQWYRCKFQVDAIYYNCCEQFMMASKARLFGDDLILNKIMRTTNPKTQKTLGRSISGFNVNVWNDRCRDYVYEANWAKFTQNMVLKEELLATAGTTLVEASADDKLWGIGRGMTDPGRLDRSTWQGTNWLGEVLTKVREDIINDKKTTSNFDWSKEVHLYTEMPPV